MNMTKKMTNNHKKSEKEITRPIKKIQNYQQKNLQSYVQVY